MHRLNEVEAAKYLGMPWSTLNLWRRRGTGPPCTKLPGNGGRNYKIFYDKKDLDDFIKKRRDIVSGLFTVKQAAAYLGVSINTLGVHRYQGSGPEYIKIDGGFIDKQNKYCKYFYSKEALDKYKSKNIKDIKYNDIPMMSLHQLIDKSGVSDKALACLRKVGLGPKFSIIKNKIYYNDSSADDYIYKMKHERPRLTFTSGVTCRICGSIFTYWKSYWQEGKSQRLYEIDGKPIYCSECGIEWLYSP